MHLNSPAFLKSVLKFPNTKIGDCLHDLEVGKDFLARTKKALTIKGMGTKPQTQRWLLTGGDGGAGGWSRGSPGTGELCAIKARAQETVALFFVTINLGVSRLRGEGRREWGKGAHRRGTVRGSDKMPSF